MEKERFNFWVNMYLIFNIDAEIKVSYHNIFVKGDKRNNEIIRTHTNYYDKNRIEFIKMIEIGKSFCFIGHNLFNEFCYEEAKNNK